MAARLAPMPDGRVPSSGRKSRSPPAPAALAWSEAQVDARARTMSCSPLLPVVALLGVADAAIIIGCGLAAIGLRQGSGPVAAEIPAVAAFAGLLGVNAIHLVGGYRLRGPAGSMLPTGRALQAWTVVFFLLLIAGYLSKSLEAYSRPWAVGWYIATASGLILVRVAAHAKVRRLRQSGRLATTTAVVDLCGAGAAFARDLVRDSSDLRLVGVFTPSCTVPGRAGGCANDNPGRRRNQNGLEALVGLSRLFRIDEVLVLVADETRTDIAAILRRLGTIPATVRLCPSVPSLAQIPVHDASLWNNRPAFTVHHRPLGGWSSAVKRAEDLVLGGVLAVLLAPLMLLLALMIKADSRGPVLFRQPRQGFNHNVFTVLKFRTMVHRNAPENDVPQATRNDSRVTRLGRLLRRTSLDELPQIFNVLRGDMSLVGPRPHAIVHNELYAGLIDDYLGRHRVQPGITGWAQINGLRGETETLDKMQRRVEHDLTYIDNWSVLLDLKIICKTAWSVVRDRHAY